MNEIVKVFNDRPVRIIEKDGDPWFVAKDVCDVLELSNPRTSLSLLDDDEKGVHSMDTLGGIQDMTTVNEPGLYSLILRSRKPGAKVFKRWITHEVLPSIRKTGAYLSPAMTDSQVQALMSTLEQEMSRRINAEGRLKLLENQLKKVAKKALPANFGELSKKTGLPKDKLVKPYARSDSRPHKPQLFEYFQLLLPLYFTDEIFRDNQVKMLT